MKTVPYSRRLRLQNIFSNLVTRIIVPLFRSCSTFSFYFKLGSPSFINQCYLFKIVQDLLVSSTDPAYPTSAAPLNSSSFWCPSRESNYLQIDREDTCYVYMLFALLRSHACIMVVLWTLLLQNPF